ncbi:MAG: hypothetical protein R2688_05410 [Fimbriimonadaceae bacterium]
MMKKLLAKGKHRNIVLATFIFFAVSMIYLSVPVSCANSLSRLEFLQYVTNVKIVGANTCTADWNSEKDPYDVLEVTHPKAQHRISGYVFNSELS